VRRLSLIKPPEKKAVCCRCLEIFIDDMGVDRTCPNDCGAHLYVRLSDADAAAKIEFWQNQRDNARMK
jgi:hypothetical protein